MRIYLNTSALNRPLDDLSSERVRVEAEAMVALLAAVEDGTVEWIGSEYLDFEVGQDPVGERVKRSTGRLTNAKIHTPSSTEGRGSDPPARTPSRRRSPFSAPGGYISPRRSSPPSAPSRASASRSPCSSPI